MKKIILILIFNFLVSCQRSQDFFFVPQMQAYNRLLCQSGLPGTQNPLICPQMSNVYPLMGAQPHMRQFRPMPVQNMQTIQNAQMNYVLQNHILQSRRRRVVPQIPQIIPVQPIPLMTPDTEKRIQEEEKKDNGKIYLIPWHSKKENPLINYILVPEELLSPSAPLDILKNEHKFEETNGHEENEEEDYEHEENDQNDQSGARAKITTRTHERAVHKIKEIEAND